MKAKPQVGAYYKSNRSGETYLVTAVGKRYALVEIISQDGGAHEFPRKLAEFKNYKKMRVK
jgi:hypothetical protein